VLDDSTSVFMYGQCLWLLDRDDDPDREFTGGPSALRLVVGIASDGSCKQLARETLGPLRAIPDASADVVEAVARFGEAEAFGDLIRILPTPAPLRSGASGAARR
jgi:hypothetical protein